MTETEKSGGDICLDIDSLTYGRNGIGRDQGRVVLVPGTAPGDRVEVQITESKKKYAIGAVTRLLKPAAIRRSPPCPHAGNCGGCPWQHIEYSAQLAAKEKCIKDALQRIGKLKDFEMHPIIPSSDEFRFRRRIRLQCDADKRLGFHRAATHEIVEIDSCLIADPKAEESLPTARSWVRELKTEIRFLEIVVGDLDKKAILIGKAEGEFHSDDDERCKILLQLHQQVSGLILLGPGWRHSWGETTTLIQLDSSSWAEVPGDIFMQVNREANHRLVDQVLNWGAFGPAERLLELYCGAGNLTLPIARLSREVVAVEWNRRSIDSGQKTARLNRTENIHWICADVSKAVGRMAKREENFSKVILNPPRAGAKGLDQNLPSLNAEKIFYISCDPATLARDLQALTLKGYRLTRIQPVDLFPQTFHVETLAELIAS